VLDGMVYIVGGDTGRQVIRYVPASGASLLLAPAVNERRGDCTDFVLGGYLYATGGGADFSIVERYDVSTNKWTKVADFNLPGRGARRIICLRRHHRIGKPIRGAAPLRLADHQSHETVVRKVGYSVVFLRTVNLRSSLYLPSSVLTSRRDEVYFQM
jgi:hypothetical protein